MNASTRHVQRARERNGSGQLNVPLTLDAPFPALENLVSLAKRNPYALIGVMIGIASLVVGAVVTLAIAVLGGMFIMYGTMRENTVLMGSILKKQETIEHRQLEDGKVMRAYESANGKRIEFIVALQSKENQRLINEYDAAHPVPSMPQERKE